MEKSEVSPEMLSPVGPGKKLSEKKKCISGGKFKEGEL